VFTFDGFFDHLGSLDWPAVIVSTLVLMVVGTVWYGPLFGKPWARAHGIPFSTKPEPIKIIKTAAYMFLFSVGVSFFVFDDIEHALVAGLLFGFLFIAMALYSGVVWAKKSARAYTFDLLFWIVAVILATYVQGLLA